jgi:hypothetical protein
VGGAAYFAAWVRSFAFTQIVEVPIYLRGVPGNRWRAGAIAFGASALTHPIVWYVFPRLHFASYLRMAVAAEAFAFLAEAVYLWCFGVRGPARALGWSTLANGASLGLSLLSRALFGVP